MISLCKHNTLNIFRSHEVSPESQLFPSGHVLAMPTQIPASLSTPRPSSSSVCQWRLHAGIHALWVQRIVFCKGIILKSVSGDNEKDDPPHSNIHYGKMAFMYLNMPVKNCCVCFCCHCRCCCYPCFLYAGNYILWI